MLKLAPKLSLPLELSTCWSPVVRLLLWSGPAAVLRRVRPIVVFAVDGIHRRWSGPHISIERREVISPRSADGYPATTVRRVVWTSWIQAAVLDVRPAMEFRRLSHPVGSVRRRRSLALQTAAREDFLAEMVLPNRRGATAVAATDPCAVTRAWPCGFVKDDQTSKPLSGEACAARSHTSYFIPKIQTCWGI